MGEEDELEELSDHRGLDQHLGWAACSGDFSSLSHEEQLILSARGIEYSPPTSHFS